MKIKNLYVVNGICPMDIISTSRTKTETSYIKPNCICEKIEEGQHIYYEHLEMQQTFHQTDKIGINRINGTPIPLSDYYYSTGIKKRNDHENKKEVYEKVKKLKKIGIL